MTLNQEHGARVLCNHVTQRIADAGQTARLLGRDGGRACGETRGVQFDRRRQCPHLFDLADLTQREAAVLVCLLLGNQGRAQILFAALVRAEGAFADLRQLAHDNFALIGEVIEKCCLVAVRIHADPAQDSAVAAADRDNPVAILFFHDLAGRAVIKCLGAHFVSGAA